MRRSSTRRGASAAQALAPASLETPALSRAWLRLSGPLFRPRDLSLAPSRPRSSSTTSRSSRRSSTLPPSGRSAFRRAAGSTAAREHRRPCDERRAAAGVPFYERLPPPHSAQYSRLFRRARGMYFSAEDRGNMHAMARAGTSPTTPPSLHPRPPPLLPTFSPAPAPWSPGVQLGQQPRRRHRRHRRLPRPRPRRPRGAGHGDLRRQARPLRGGAPPHAPPVRTGPAPRAAAVA